MRVRAVLAGLMVVGIGGLASGSAAHVVFDGFRCEQVFGQLAAGTSGDGRRVESPDGKWVAWSTARRDRHLRSQVIVGAPAAPSNRTVLRSGDGEREVGRHGRAPVGWYDGLCVVDWSAGSRHVLIEQNAGPADTDIGGITTWLYDREVDRHWRVDDRPLGRVVRHHLRSTRRETAFLLVPVGWDVHRAQSIAFAAVAAWSNDFFGYWSTSLTGAHPALITLEGERPARIRRFGRARPE